MSEKRPWIYAIDFDGTIVEDKWPEIGDEKKETVEFIKKIHSLGCLWILWTCRTDEKLKKALDWCLAHGLTPDAVNENVHPRCFTTDWNPRKVYADFYIDDKSSGGFVLPPVPSSLFKE